MRACSKGDKQARRELQDSHKLSEEQLNQTHQSELKEFDACDSQVESANEPSEEDEKPNSRQSKGPSKQAKRRQRKLEEERIQLEAIEKERANTPSARQLEIATLRKQIDPLGLTIRTVCLFHQIIQKID